MNSYGCKHNQCLTICTLSMLSRLSIREVHGPVCRPCPSPHLQHPPTKSTKTAPRRFQDASRCRLLAIIFDAILGCFSRFLVNLAPTCVRKSTINYENQCQQLIIPILHSCFDRCWIDFCLIFRYLKPQVLINLCWFYHIFCFYACFI